MKKIFFYASSLFILVGCNSNSENQNSSDLNNQNTDLVDPEVALTNTDDAFEGLVDSFPKRWINVEVLPNKMIYTKRCDASNPQLYIEKNVDHWEIVTVYGQDAENWHLINMTANQDFYAEQQIQEGIFVVEKITYPDNEIYEVSYFWNMTKGFCSFGDFFGPTVKFANEAESKSYETVTEKCD